jgi:hypothetical protein
MFNCETILSHLIWRRSRGGLGAMRPVRVGCRFPVGRRYRIGRIRILDTVTSSTVQAA